MSENAVTEPPGVLMWFDGQGNGLEIRPGGALRIHHGGFVVTKTLEAWLEVAWPKRSRGVFGDRTDPGPQSGNSNGTAS